MVHQAHYGIDPAKLEALTVGANDTEATHSFLIVDDHALVRYGLSLAVRQRFPDASVHEAGTLADGLHKVRSLPELSAVLYDLQMDDSNGREGLELMLRTVGDVPLIVVSGVNDTGIIAGCIRAGARGFVPKGCDSVVLDQALPIVLSGGIYAPPPPPPPPSQRSRQPATAFMEAPSPSSVPAKVSNPVDQLTERQREVLRLLLEGQSNKEIARALGVLEGTIKVHLRAVMQRLGARNRTQLALAAVKAGLT
ncbi:LuxR C-terminal-related transcriptional regulator [Azospirillum doebereinerae]